MKEISLFSQVFKCDIQHQKKNRTISMDIPSEEEVHAEFEKIMKIYECYRFLVFNTDDEQLRKKITEIGREHLASKINEIKYITLIAVQKKKDELLRKMADLGKE